MIKICQICSTEFEGSVRRSLCDSCRTEQRKVASRKWRASHKSLANERNRKYYSENREKVLQVGSDWRKKPGNIEKERARKRRYRSGIEDPRKTDPVLRLRHMVSCSVRNAMKKTGGTKRGSILDALPYKIDELKNHLEKHFEPWMSWDNYGRYDPKTWDDDDQSTWTWQIDHVTPQSELKYSSMDDDNFAICWSPSNLRPLSSKKNNMDGVNRTRHVSV